MAYFLCGKLNPVPPVSARNHTPEGNGILDFLGSVHSGGRDICKIVQISPDLGGWRGLRQGTHLVWLQLLTSVLLPFLTLISGSG